MRILIVSYFFSPFNVIGAVRVTKLAEYWASNGHDVLVLSAKNQPLPKELSTKFPKKHVVYTNWININYLPERIMGGRKAISSRGFDTNNSFLKVMGHIYKSIFNFPDGQIGWFPYASKAGSKIISDGWKPDLIYASASPVTSFLIASRLSRKFSIPWVAEYRDLWTDNHNYNYPNWRLFLESVIEKKIIKSASALVTVSKPLAKVLLAKQKKPTKVVMNGFDHHDYDSKRAANYFSNKKLNIVYTGMIYPAKHDPTPFLEALNKPEFKKHIRVYFFGRYLGYINSLAKKYKLQNVVRVFDSISHKKAILIQQSADILLFLAWNDKNNKGVLTGKLFEYFGARHPILAIGSHPGLAGKFILERNAGLVTDNILIIEKQLRKWIKDKATGKKNFKLKSIVSKGLSRSEQFEKLDHFLMTHNLMTKKFTTKAQIKKRW